MAKLKPKPLDEYFVFLASPGDVDKERQTVRKFFEDYNRNTGRHHGLRFTVLDWENYGEAGVGRPQDLITKQTLERYKDSLALVIGLMAQRFGTPTGDHESGTEEEFEWAYQQYKETGWPEIKWFFREIDKLEIPTDGKEAKALEQWESVKAFRKRVQQEGDRQLYYKSYTNVDNFREVLKNDLDSWLADPQRRWSATDSSGESLHVDTKTGGSVNPNAATTHLCVDFVDSLTKISAHDESSVETYRSQLREEALEGFPSNLQTDEFLIRCKVLKDGRLTVAGVLLFTKCPHSGTLPSASTQFVRYHGTDKSTKTLDRTRIDGTVIEQLTQSFRLVLLNIRKSEQLGTKSPRQEITYEYPTQCIREVIANALCHRDYEDNHRIVHIRVYDDRIEVLSPGTWLGRALPEASEVALSELISEPIQRNTTLAHAMAAISLVETEGRGLILSVAECEEANARIPRVLQTDGYVRVTIFPKKDWQSESKIQGTVQCDPSAYLQRLRDKSQYIDIRGLQTGTGRAHRFPIDELYIPLTTHGPPEQAEKGRRGKGVEEMEPGGREPVDLRECLKHRCLVVLGDPGAGKTTFLRRVAFELCRRQLGEGNATAAAPWSALGEAFPILVPLAALARHQTVAREQRTGPHGDDVAEWLVHFATTRAHETGVGLDEAFFRSILKDGRAIVLLDALDEVPSSQARLVMRTLIENAVGDYAKCRFIVTSRPAAFVGDVVLAGFEQVRIAPLEEEAIETFLRRWCLALADDNEADAKEHLDELLIPLRKLPEVRRMARNPVMLTALAVVHWNEKRLPEQRAELYESIIGWLAKQRPHSAGRPKPEQCVALLQNLALAMQDHRKGRQTQFSRHWGARAIAPSFREVPEDERVSAAEAFLSEEEVDSGIIVGRGEHEIRFWHLTFQEYLAARGLATQSDKVQAEILLATDKLYAQEWREVVLLMAGVLHRQGIERVDGMFETILATVGPKAPLKDKARCAGLLNAILNDLGSVGYKPDNERYANIIRDALAVFDAIRSKGIPIKVAIEAAEAIARGGDPRFTDQQSKQNWIEIPAGEFLMGAQKEDEAASNYDHEAYDDESPAHEVRLEANRIGKYPVTVGEYERFVGACGYTNEDHWKAGGFEDNEQPARWEEQLTHLNRPVTYVSWHEAMAYAHWAECRLPTEAEWERVARGTQGHRYPWGNTDPDVSIANYKSNIGNPTPVGVYPRGGTPEGIQDMAGNVWEWCRDVWHDSYEGAPADGSAWTSGREQSARVLRGGSWSDGGQHLRSAYRYRLRPDDRDDDVGFRVSAGT